MANNRSLLRRPIVLVLVGCLISPAQQEQTPVFRTGTTLVEFTVVALDSKGKPVADLKKEEILITEQGKPREVAFFRFEGGAVDEKTRQPQPLPPGVFTNRPQYTAGPPRNITAILIDSINTPPADQPYARDELMRYLRALPPDTRAAVYGLGHELVVLHDFTDDAESLRSRMEEKLKKFPITVSPDVKEIDCLAFADCSTSHVSEAETVWFQQAGERRRNLTLGSLEVLGNHLAGIPGRKSLVWIGGGVSIFSMTGAYGFGTHGGFKNYEAQIRKTAQRLASQGITVYPVDSKALVRGTIPPGPNLRDFRTGPGMVPNNTAMIIAAVLSNGYPESTNDVLAETTGGRVVRLTNNLAKGMELAASDQRASYSVGFYAGGEPDGKWHGLNVKVKRSGVKLSYRQGFTSELPQPQPEDWSDEQWSKVIYSPLGSTRVRLDAKSERQPATGILAVVLQIAAPDLFFRSVNDQLTADLEIAMAEKAPDGKYTIHRENTTVQLPADKTAATGVARYSNGWKTNPDSTTIRLIVRDRFTGNYGTLDLLVKEIPTRAQ